MTVPHAHPRRSWARRVLRALPWTAAGLFVAVIVVAEWWFWPRPAPLAPGWTASVVVLAGDGQPGTRDGAAAAARFSDPFGIAAAADGTLFVADAGDSPRIRVITPGGTVFALAGGVRGFRDGPGDAARFDTPSGIALDGNGSVVVADTGNNAIRRVSPAGEVTTVAGDGAPGLDDGPAGAARFNGPLAVAVDPHDGRILVADAYNDRIRVIQPDGVVTTLAGTVRGFTDGPATEARFNTPGGIAVAADGTVLVADTGNGAVRVIDAHGTVITPDHAPGLVNPFGIAVSREGEVYVADDRGRIVAFGLAPPSGEADAARIEGRTVAGSRPGFRDGIGRDAEFRRPSGIALLGPGRLAVADAGNALIRLVADPSRMELRPPASPRVRPAFDVEAFARVPLLWPLAPQDEPSEIAGTLGEARGEHAERLHSGIDVRVEQGTPVRAVRDGVVEGPIDAGAFGTLNEWLRVGPITYVHVRVGRARGDRLYDVDRFVPHYDERGRLAGIRVKRGARFSTGEIIASVNPFNHVHLNVGWPGEEYNPLDFRLVNFEDTIPPTIPANGVGMRQYGMTGSPS
jgi:DNA-binding beta-propeller fold protein YncE